MDKTIIIQLLNEAGEPTGTPVLMSRTTVIGELIPGHRVSIKGRSTGGIVVAQGRLSGGAPPRLQHNAPDIRTRKTEEDQDPDYTPSDDEDEDSDTELIRAAERIEAQETDQTTTNEPAKEELKRWRKAKPETWKRNVSKEKRRSGQEYETKDGRVVPPKQPKDVGQHNCRYRCTEKITEEQRETLCNEYWHLADYKRQKDYLLKSILVKVPQQRRVEAEKSRRGRSLSYTFFTDSEAVVVCKTFFLNTLHISGKVIETALKGRSETATFEGEDGRGRTTPTNKMSGETVNLIREHISKFPAVESHYCRASSRRLYLDSNLSLGKLYHLYCQFCNEQNPPTNPVSITSYKRIICNENNIGFHHPRKDQCARCAKFELATDKSEELQQEYESHRARAQAAQNSKRMSKEMAMNDKSIVTATFDLQSVLQLPYADISPFYYKRKLWVYNFTIFDGVSKEGYCFLWNEIDGKRGSDEIGSCLLDWLSSQPESCTNVRLFSDSCGGQNRNQFIAAALLYAAQKLQFHEITMSYLEPGHTQMEVDSMHSAIEREKKGERVFTMQEWEALLKRSRRGQEYRVRRMKHTDFKSLKKLAAEIINNRSVDEQGHTVNWMKIKALRFVKGEQTAIYYNYGYDDDSFKRIFVRKGKSAGRLKFPDLQPAYVVPNKINSKKKKDLVDLCKSGLIPEEVCGWYENLLCSDQSAVAVDVSEPSDEESDDESSDPESDSDSDLPLSAFVKK